MATLTLNLSDDLVDRIQAIPEAELSVFLKEIVEQYEAQQEASLLSAPLSAEDIAAIGQGLEDAKAGRVRDGATVLAELRQRAGLP